MSDNKTATTMAGTLVLSLARASQIGRQSSSGEDKLAFCKRLALDASDAMVSALKAESVRSYFRALVVSVYPDLEMGSNKSPGERLAGTTRVKCLSAAKVHDRTIGRLEGVDSYPLFNLLGSADEGKIAWTNLQRIATEHNPAEAAALLSGEAKKVGDLVKTIKNKLGQGSAATAKAFTEGQQDSFVVALETVTRIYRAGHKEVKAT